MVKEVSGFKLHIILLGVFIHAGIGFVYDATRDAFYPPQPYPSWTLNEKTCLWEAPVDYPDDKKFYDWNEEKKSWDLSSFKDGE